MSQSGLRRNLFKEAARGEVERWGLAGGVVLLGGAALLTVATTPWLAPLWLAGAGLGGLAAGINGARRRLADEHAVPALARRTVLQHHAPDEVPPELQPYVVQAVESAIEIVTRVEQSRGTPLYPGMSDVVDTVGALLDRIRQMSDRIVATERLFGRLQQQVRTLPGAQLQGAAARDFDRNLFNLQKSIDAAREQIVAATASLNQIGVQVLMLQAQDAAMIDETTGDLRRLASDQAEMLQARISAMDEIAATTEAATGRLLGGG